MNTTLKVPTIDKLAQGAVTRSFACGDTSRFYAILASVNPPPTLSEAKELMEGISDAGLCDEFNELWGALWNTLKSY